jgi:hypothetical protein
MPRTTQKSSPPQTSEQPHPPPLCASHPSAPLRARIPLSTLTQHFSHSDTPHSIRKIRAIRGSNTNQIDSPPSLPWPFSPEPFRLPSSKFNTTSTLCASSPSPRLCVPAIPPPSPSPFTLHPSPFTLHPSPFTLQRSKLKVQRSTFNVQSSLLFLPILKIKHIKPHLFRKRHQPLRQAQSR